MASANPCSGLFRGPHPKSEKETRAIVKTVKSLGENLKAFLTIHSFSQLWLTGWSFANLTSETEAQEVKNDCAWIPLYPFQWHTGGQINFVLSRLKLQRKPQMPFTTPLAKCTEWDHHLKFCVSISPGWGQRTCVVCRHRFSLIHFACVLWQTNTDSLAFWERRFVFSLPLTEVNKICMLTLSNRIWVCTCR